MLFDFDGTLAPIASHPDLAVLSSSGKGLLTELAHQDRYILGVVSGRSLADVRNKVGIPNLIYAGNHGLEIQGSRVEFTHPEAAALVPTLNQIYGELQTSLSHQSGIALENKALSLSVHFRATPDELVPLVKSTFYKITTPYVETGEVKIGHGKQVLEVRPNVDWNKGRAIRMLMDVFPEASLAAFFGDDMTDEDGFEVVQEAGGLAVFVGEARQPTKALYRVDSPQEVLETLRLLRDL